MRFCDGCGTPQPLHPLEIPFMAYSLARRHTDFACMTALFLATAMSVLPLFTGDFTNHWGTIEGAYIADSIFVSNYFPNVGWFPYWYGGLPFHLSYPPLFIYSVAVLHLLSGFSIPYSYRLLMAISYTTAPAAVYVIAKFLTKRSLPSFFAGLTYSFVPTFMPDPLPSHLGQIIGFGEGPHFFGMTLAFLALFQLLRSMAKPTWFNCLASAILIASVALSNLVALYALTFLMLIAVAVEAVYRNDAAILAFLLSGAIGLGLVAYQYDLEFIQTNAYESTSVTTALKYSGLLLPALVVGVLLLRHYIYPHLAKRPHSKEWIFAGLWITLLGSIIIGFTWFQLQSVPQPRRYVPEFDAGVSLLIGLILAKIAKGSINWKYKPRMPFQFPPRTWVIAALLVLLTASVILLAPLSIKYTPPTPVVSAMPEFQVANWLSDHVTDQRIFASGSISFWLNVFSNVPQIRGGSDQGATNTWWADVSYQILSGSDPSISVLWLQAWNVRYVVVTFPNASLYSHDYTYPNKFNNVLPLRYYIAGYGIYEVPLNRSSLVEPISVQTAESQTPISSVLDVGDIAAYDHLTQANTGSNATATYSYPNPDLLQVDVTGATTDTGILVKMTFDPRWVAEVNGEPVETGRIGPDFLIAYPRTYGSYRLTFRFEYSLGETLGLYETFATIILLSIVSVNRLNARRRSRKTVAGEVGKGGVQAIDLDANQFFRHTLPRPHRPPSSQIASSV